MSVTTSAIYRKALKAGEVPPIMPSGMHNQNREIYWIRPSWLIEDGLPDWHNPKGPIMEQEKPKPPG